MNSDGHRRPSQADSLHLLLTRVLCNVHGCCHLARKSSQLYSMSDKAFHHARSLIMSAVCIMNRPSLTGLGFSNYDNKLATKQNKNNALGLFYSAACSS